MATVKWTADQESAIYLRPKKMLVSAAAGSGKTAVLSERILKRLTDEGSCADITKFLIVTYTRLAASELRARIGKKLREASVNSEGELSRRLARQCNRLGSAYISTIHSYCAALVKRHFRELDLPPVLKVCEEAQALEIKDRLMEKLMETAYNGEFAPIPDFEAFANNFVTVGDRMLTDKLLKLYQTVVGLPDGFGKWESAARMLASDTPFLHTPWGELTVKSYVRRLRYFALNYESCIDALKYDDKCEKYRTLAESELTSINRLTKAIESVSLPDIQCALSDISFASLPSVRSPESAEQRDHFRGNVRNPLKDFIAELKGEPLFASESKNGDDPSAITEIRKKCSDISLSLVALLKEFDCRYKAEKRRLGILDFADLEQYTYKLLYNSDGTLTPLSHEVSASFDEILVDEFQDVNPMQSKIFEALSCECSIFQVGDIKQSIYGFRGAEPSIFADCRRRYTALDREREETKNAEELTVFLSANFRSMFPVTAFVNRIFSPIFHTPDDYPYLNDRIPYSPSDQLICKRGDAYEDAECTVPKRTASPVKLTVIEVPRASRQKKTDSTEDNTPSEPKLSATEAECLTVAREIEHLIKSGVKGSDIAIVARSSNHVALIEEMLLSRGITVSNDKGAPLADMPEVQLALSVLSCVDNPHKDVSLAGALRSPIFGFTFDELISVRNHKKGVSLYSALKGYTEEHTLEKGRRFIEFIDRIRAASAGQPASRVLWQIYIETDFFSLIYDGGKASPTLAAARRANLIKLHSLASDGETVGRDGIYTFIRRFEKLSETNNAPTAASVNDGETVKFYTAHGSKGLEFPHCFICGLGHSPQKSQQRDTSADTVCDNELGIAVKLRDSTAIVKMDTPIRKAIAAKMKYTQLEEELRILYVELTRARDNLYVTATTDNLEKLMSTAKNAAKIKDPTVYESLSTPIEWILTALHTEENGSVFLPPELLEIKTLTEEQIRTEKDAKTANDTVNPEETAQKAEADPELTRLLTERLSAKYKYALSSTLPAKMSVSRLYPTLLDEDDGENDPLYAQIQKAAKSTNSIEGEGDTVTAPKLDLTASLTVGGEEKKTASPLKTPLFALGARLTGIRDKVAEESDGLAEDTLRSALKYNKFPDDIDSLTSTVSSAEKGTATHLFMQFCDFESIEKNGVDAEIARLCEKQFILPYHATIIDKSLIEKFMTSKTYAELKGAKRVRREVRFNTRLPARMFTTDIEKAEALEDETLLVQGVIDCYYTTEDGKTVLLDYKTDTFPEDMSEKRIAAILRKRHSMQLYYYKLALERLLLRPVDRVEIYSFALGKSVELRFEK